MNKPLHYVDAKVDILEGRIDAERQSTAPVPVEPRTANAPAGINPDEAKNRIFFNGSSYSGADIKVLVHRYDRGPEAAIAELNSAIVVYSRVNDLLTQVKQGIIPRIKAVLEQVKSGDATYDDIEAARQTYFAQIGAIRGLENSLGNNGNSLGYYQNVGNQLSSSSATAVLNPNGLAESIIAIQLQLTGLVEDWIAVKSALQSNPTGYVATKTLAELQTISISTDRDKRPVRAFGQVGAKGFVRGPRTVAGSMIFTVFDRHVLWELLGASNYDADDAFKPALMDQLPPIDITISFANEYGSLSRMTLYAVEFVNEGRTMSIENLLLEDVVQYVARDVDIMTPVLDEDGLALSNRILHFNQASYISKYPHRIGQVRASDLLGTDEEDSNISTPVKRYKRRNNPFF